MSSCDDYIEKITRDLPDPCTTKDLIKAGIFSSDQAASYARRHGIAPDFFKFKGRGVIYPKDGVIAYLERSKHPMAI